jgi:CheY-like chemotaxis protein
MLLDYQMPHKNGIEVVKAVRDFIQEINARA